MLTASEAPHGDYNDIPDAYRHGRHVRKSQSWLNRLMVAFLPFLPQAAVKPFARRYVAGDSLADLCYTIETLNVKGFLATADLLGEFIHTPTEADETLAAYQQVIETVATKGLNANISIKLTALGLLLNEEVCYQRMVILLTYANRYKQFVRIDMEDTGCTEKTIQLYLRLRETYTNVGIVIQAYLRRTHDDITRITAAEAGHFRLCKGIYVEPRWLAYQLPDVINQNYLALLQSMFEAKAYVGIATHDERLVWGAIQLIRQFNLKPDQYEFQMLLGVDAELRDMLLAAGHRVRIYVPFGRQWYAYCMRRLKENPKIAGYILKNLLKRT